jgi:hypothetical protein
MTNPKRSSSSIRRFRPELLNFRVEVCHFPQPYGGTKEGIFKVRTPEPLHVWQQEIIKHTIVSIVHRANPGLCKARSAGFGSSTHIGAGMSWVLAGRFAGLFQLPELVWVSADGSRSELT